MGVRPSPEPSELYVRQTVMKELGKAGQQRLRSARVVVVGLGGLGSISSMYLALAGVGFLRLVDQDTVEPHNLHRQSLFTVDDIMQPKAEAAANRIRKMAPFSKVEAVVENLRSSNAEGLLGDVDLMVDGLDNMRTRYVLNSYSVRSHKPYIYGAAIAMEGNASVFHPPETPCLRCITPGVDDSTLSTCETRGVLGPTAGTIGSIQAMEAIKLIAGIRGGLEGRLLTCDLQSMDFYAIRISKRPDCDVCGSGIRKRIETKRLTWLCGSNTVNVNPPEPLKIDLLSAADALSQKYQVLFRSPVMVVLRLQDGIEVSLFSQGRMLIKNIKSEEEALRTQERLLSLI